jgi:uncharacterized membrane protein YGL010W
MAKPNLKIISPKKEDLRRIDVYFNRLDASHQNPTNRLIHWFCVPLMVLGILGMAWALPFPHIGFLGQYNGYFNWASFIIAFAIYYYLKLSPLLSYFALFLLFGISYGVMQLAAWEHAGGPPLALISPLILFAALAGQYIGSKIEGKDESFNDDTRLLHVTPLWMLYSLTKRFGLRY